MLDLQAATGLKHKLEYAQPLVRGSMMDSDELAVLTLRLEAALERIAEAARNRAAGSGAEPGPDRILIAAQLDNTIARLKSALGEA